MNSGERKSRKKPKAVRTKDSHLVPPTHFKGVDKKNVELVKAINKIEYGFESIFITGKAGTGKSTLIRLLQEFSRKQLIVLAPTGIAAINARGQTLHSFFKFPIRPLLKGDKGIFRFPRSSDQYSLVRNADCIIIDEISMVRADLLDAVDYSLRLNTGNRHTPFGGKQMIFVGDPFQLPPVVTSDDQQIIKQLYPSPYFFDAESFDRDIIDLIELKYVYRQRDEYFQSLLNKIRSNTADFHDLNVLNDRYLPAKREALSGITLCSTNYLASDINERELNRLDTEEFMFKGKIEGDFPKSALPTEMRLYLKEGAQVIFIKNDPDGRWVNGKLGKVDDIGKDTIKVLLENGEIHEVEPHTWENCKYIWDMEKGTIEQEVLGTFSQYPLKLAWAITIHKSQGLTFDQINLDLGRGAFAHGQLYVALSRCKQLDGIHVLNRLQRSDIIVDERVAEAHLRKYEKAGHMKLF